MQTDELLDLINKTVSPVKAETGKYENNGSDAYSNIEKGADCIQNIDPAVTNDDNTNVGAGNVQSYDNASSCRDVVNDEPACEVHYSHESRTIGEQSSNAESVLHQGQSSVCGTLIKEEPPDQTDTEQSSVCNTLMKVEQSDQNDIQTLDYSKCSSCGNSIIQSNLTDELKKTQKELESTKRSVVRVERQLEKADSYNNVLRNMVEQLSGEIHRYKNAKTQSISIQVDQDDFLNYITGDYTMPLWNADGHSTLQTSEGQGEIAIADPMEQSQSDQALAEPLSIADSVKAAAEAVVQQQTNEALLQSGYVYDDQSGHYYHTETGYYYNTEKGLYYDPTSYTYFYYNYDTGEYQFHSKVDPSEYYNIQTQATPNNQLTQDQKAILAKKKKEKKKKKAKLEDDKIYKNRRERRKAMLERKLKKKEKKTKKKKKHSDSKKKKKKRDHSDDESEWDSDLERVIHRSEGRHKKKKRKHAKKDRRDKKKMTSKENDGADNEKADANDKPAKNDKEVKDVSIQNVGGETLGKVSQNRNDDKDKKKEASPELSEEIVVENGKAKDKTSNPNQERDDLSDISEENEDITINDKPYDRIKYVKPEESENMECCSIKKESCDTEMHTNDEYDQHRDVVSISSNSLHGDSIVISDEDVEMESGELSDSTTTSDSSEDSSDTYSEISSSEENMKEEQLEQHQEIAGQWPPCIRMIVTESDCVDIGMLYLVTCSGATIGREGDRKHDIPLPDINISKWHAEIKFNTDKRQYEIVDKGSQNGTFVNDERLSVAKETSSPRPLIHGDKVQLGDSKLLCHIHMGTDTCDDCEPGIVMARHKALQPLPEVKILSAEEKKKIQKDQMKEIKKKYGLKNANYEVHKSLRNTDYANRAEERRQTVGSDTPGVKQTSAPASVHRPISTENVGHKLLQKMGWKAGESLGKSNTGIQEPISVTLRANQAAGLGSATAGSFSADAANTVDLKKASRRAQAQQRYNKIDNHTNQQSDDRDSKSKEMEVARESKRKGLTWCKGDTEFT